MKKFIKRSLEVIMLLGFGMIIYTIITTKPTPTPSIDTDDDIDTIDIYDDKEFYYMTHDENGVVNEYGKSLE